jgi:hypothetical protein
VTFIPWPQAVPCLFMNEKPRPANNTYRYRYRRVALVATIHEIKLRCAKSLCRYTCTRSFFFLSILKIFTRNLTLISCRFFSCFTIQFQIRIDIKIVCCITCLFSHCSAGTGFFLYCFISFAISLCRALFSKKFRVQFEYCSTLRCFWP